MANQVDRNDAPPGSRQRAHHVAVQVGPTRVAGHQQDRIAPTRPLLGMGDTDGRAVVGGDGGVVRLKGPTVQALELRVRRAQNLHATQISKEAR